MKHKLSIYEEVIHLTHAHLGAEAAQHISKVIQMHLRKPPKLITKEELISLMDWITIAVAFLREEQEITERYLAELSALLEREEE